MKDTQLIAQIAATLLAAPSGSIAHALLYDSKNQDGAAIEWATGLVHAARKQET